MIRATICVLIAFAFSIGVASADAKKAADLIQQERYFEAYKHLKYEANQDSADVQYLIAHLYLNGFGVEENLKTAHGWQGRAAQNGNATAQYLYGVDFFRGRGTQIDYAKAYH